MGPVYRKHYASLKKRRDILRASDSCWPNSDRAGAGGLSMDGGHRRHRLSFRCGGRYASRCSGECEQTISQRLPRSQSMQFRVRLADARDCRPQAPPRVTVGCDYALSMAGLSSPYLFVRILKIPICSRCQFRANDLDFRNRSRRGTSVGFVSISTCSLT
jgi:hypothetical protein